jgi:Uma2 family endonuclease
MPMVNEIVLPECKPELEWILGQAVQKVSPQRPHALLQRELGARLGEWARNRGEVGTEWRFRLQPPGEIIRPLVPDVSYLSYERMGEATDEALAVPLMAPDAAFEIRSPGDRQAHIDHKIGVYLACGCSVIVLIDPTARTIEAFDRNGTCRFARDDIFEHASLPGFVLPLVDLFAVLKRPR